MGWGMGIPIGWPNVQSGATKPLTGEIPSGNAFNIGYGSNYTIEFWTTNISITPPSFPRVFFSFGTDLTLHSAFLSINDNNYSLIYYINGNLIFAVDLTNTISLYDWTFFTIERQANAIGLAVNGNWVSIISNLSAFNSGGLPLYIGSNNQYLLQGIMNNFRWSNEAVYTIGLPFATPNADFNYNSNTVLLNIQGYDLPESLLDQTLNGHNMIQGTNCIYFPDNPFASGNNYAGCLYFG